jgi:hypothetical protein
MALTKCSHYTWGAWSVIDLRQAEAELVAGRWARILLSRFCAEHADFHFTTRPDILACPYLERLSLHMVFNGGYQKSHFCFSGLVKKSNAKEMLVLRALRPG